MSPGASIRQSIDTVRSVVRFGPVETEYRDAAGNVLALSDTITLDTAAPAGTMALNAGASYTTTRNVSIDSAVTGATEMRKRNLGGGGNWGSWTEYADATAHQVSNHQRTRCARWRGCTASSTPAVGARPDGSQL